MHAGTPPAKETPLARRPLWQGDPPGKETPRPVHCMLGDTVYKRAVCIPTGMQSCYCLQRSLDKVMFLQASVILLMGGCLPQCMLGYHPPWSRHPLEQTSPRSRHTPLEADTPPGADTHMGADTPHSRPPLLADTTLEADTPQNRHTPPPGSRHTAPDQTHTPPEQSMLGDTVNARAVRIILECILVI